MLNNIISSLECWTNYGFMQKRYISSLLQIPFISMQNKQYETKSHEKNHPSQQLI